MSSARMLSEVSLALRFISSERSRLERKPLTTTVSTGMPPPVDRSGAWVTARCAGARTISPLGPSDMT